MSNTGNVAIAGLILSFLLLASPVSYGQDETGMGKIHVFSGKVVSIDWAGNKLTVNYKHEDTGLTDSITLSVPSDAIFKRESEDLSFSDIEVEDNVQVEYTGDPMINPVLVALNDINMEND